MQSDVGQRACARSGSEPWGPRSEMRAQARCPHHVDCTCCHKTEGTLVIPCTTSIYLFFELNLMKRTLTLILAALVGTLLLAGLIFAVLIAAHWAEPAASTVHGATIRRLWATTSAVMAVVGVIAGGRALTRPADRFGNGSRKPGAIIGLVAGSIAAINGTLVMALADGGPGTGNGVVGGAAALVLGLIAVGLGGVATANSSPRPVT